MTGSARSAWQSAVVVGLILFVVYAATGAAALTFWDASEFATAIGTFGIPHPPGTPLYVSLGSALWHLVPGVSPVQAGTLLSALSTAAACATAAWVITRVTGHRELAAAAGVCAGAMGTVWLNATETEVYAVALLSAALQLLVAWHAYECVSAAGRTRARVLIAYLAALSVPLHLSAIVAAPAAMLLACTRRDGAVEWNALMAGGALIGASVMLSAGNVVVAILLLPASVVLQIAAARIDVRTRASSTMLREAHRWVWWAAGATLLAWSAVAILVLRARQSPFLNQGDPDTFSALVDVLSRAQYDVAPLWPRRAPLWLQLGNIGQYADWQVALSLWNDVTPSWWRTPFTVFAVAIGATGVVAHWRAHRATARAAIVLLLLATIGVCLQLNLRAGPSFGVGVLGDGALHEARERDYFFALGFWMWGLWIGIGAGVLTRRMRLPSAASVLLPVLLLMGNWSAINRAVLPDKRIATVIADVMLSEVPPGGLLFTAGDNDSYPLWYRQAVDSVRPDVQVVVTSLLPANWYFRESAWRASVAGVDTVVHQSAIDRAGILAAARLDRRDVVAVSIVVPDAQRTELGRIAGVRCWRRVGLVDVGSRRAVCPPRIDLERVTQSAARLQRVRAPKARESPDGMVRAFQGLAACPSVSATAAMRGVASLDSAARRLLDITCNLR